MSLQLYSSVHTLNDISTSNSVEAVCKVIMVGIEYDRPTENWLKGCSVAMNRKRATLHMFKRVDLVMQVKFAKEEVKQEKRMWVICCQHVEIFRFAWMDEVNGGRVALMSCRCEDKKVSE